MHPVYEESNYCTDIGVESVSEEIETYFDFSPWRARKSCLLADEGVEGAERSSRRQWPLRSRHRTLEGGMYRAAAASSSLVQCARTQKSNKQQQSLSWSRLFTPVFFVAWRAVDGSGAGARRLGCKKKRQAPHSYFVEAFAEKNTLRPVRRTALWEIDGRCRCACQNRA